MLKLLRTSDYDFGQPAVSLLPVSSLGIDDGWTIKQAAALTKEMTELRPEKNTSFIHCLAVGDTEKYGFNRNGDGFTEYWNRRNHGRFVKSGRVHKHHQNKDPSKACGQCKFSAHNDDMFRIELIIGLDNEKCASELDDYANGKELPVSMGCRVAYDVCSICGHKAPNPKFYCEHAKTAMGKILDDGRVVGVDNPDPDYFELSLVRRPADRIGYSFRKVAGEGVLDIDKMTSVDMFKAAGLWVPAHILAEEASKEAAAKLQVLQKLATIEKEIPGKLTPIDEALTQQLPDEGLTDAEIKAVHKLGTAGLGQTFGALNQAQVMLPLRDFLRLINSQGHFDVDDVCPAVGEQLPGIFGRMLEDDPMDSCDNMMFDGPGAGVLPRPVSQMVNRVLPQLGMGEMPLGRRVSITIIRSKPRGKLASVPKIYREDPLIKGLANLYAAYKLAFVTNHGNDRDPVLTRAAVLHHYQ